MLIRENTLTRGELFLFEDRFLGLSVGVAMDGSFFLSTKLAGFTHRVVNLLAATLDASSTKHALSQEPFEMVEPKVP